MRTAGSDSDHDWYETLALDYADPAHPELAAHFLGRTAVDLDGNSGLLLESSNDLQNGSLDADMYEGYVDAGTKKGDLRVRMGRQSDYLTPEIAHFDGVSVRTLKEDGPHPYEFGAYGGGNVTYDSTSNIDDGVFGVYAESRAWKGGRARLDWMHLNDAALLGADNNDLLGVSLFQNFKAWSASGKYTSLEGRDRDAELRARWADAAGKTSVQLRYFELLEPQNQRALFLDPFTQSLQTYFPYHQIGISGWRALSEKVDLDLGVDLREVNDPGDVGTFNHDWQRYYTTLTLRDLIPYAWTASVTADYYDDKQNDFKTLGADLSHPLASDWDLSLGTYYSLYKYDFFSATERDDVRTYFGKVVWRRSETWTFELLYEYEDDNLEQYNTLRCGALCRF